MEHRWGTRSELSGLIGLHHPVHGWSSGQLLNASSGGALIKTPGDIFRPNSPIMLLFQLQGPNGIEPLALPAVVVRTQTEHIGVMYLEHSETSARQLQRYIDQSRGLKRWPDPRTQQRRSA